MYPWIVEVAKERILTSISIEKPTNTLILIDKDGSFWGAKNSDYLSDYINYLNTYYYQTEDGFYVSPNLHSLCPF